MNFEKKLTKEKKLSKDCESKSKHIYSGFLYIQVSSYFKQTFFKNKSICNAFASKLTHVRTLE